MNGNHGNEAAPLCTRLCTATHFCGASAHIDCLRSREQAFGGTADERGGSRPGETLAGSSGQNISAMSAFSDRLLTALGPGALTNASPRISIVFYFGIF
jgi:hypothetical protein